MLRQKYTEVIKHYEVDEYFVEKIKDLPIDIGFDIAKQIDEVASDLPIHDFWEQKIAGVSDAMSEPYFYLVEFMNQEDLTPIFLDLHRIEMDDYLDYYIQGRIIKLNNDNKRTNEIPREGSEYGTSTRHSDEY